MTSYKGIKGVVLHRKEREMVYKASVYFENEKHLASELMKKLNKAGRMRTRGGDIPVPPDLYDQLRCFLHSALKASERVTASTGISPKTVRRIKIERAAVATDDMAADGKDAGPSKHVTRPTTPIKRPRGKAVVLDDTELCVLREIINGLTVDKEVPTLSKIFEKARSDINYKGGKTTLARIMAEKLGYKSQWGGKTKLKVTEHNTVKEHIKVKERIKAEEHINVEEHNKVKEHIKVEEHINVKEHIKVKEIIKVEEHNIVNKHIKPEVIDGDDIMYYVPIKGTLE